MSRMEADEAAARFRSQGCNVSEPKPFQRSDISLRRLETLAESWVRLTQPLPNNPVTATGTPAAAPNVDTSVNSQTPSGESGPATTANTAHPIHNPNLLPPLIPNSTPSPPLMPNPSMTSNPTLTAPATNAYYSNPYTHPAFMANAHLMHAYPPYFVNPYAHALHARAPMAHMPSHTPAQPTQPQPQLAPHHHCPTPPSPPEPEFRSPTEWAFSQDDVTFAKQLLQQGSRPLTELEKAPDPSVLVFLAPPGTCKGIFTDSKMLSGGHNVEFDPLTGSLHMKPKTTPTLRLPSSSI